MRLRRKGNREGQPHLVEIEGCIWLRPLMDLQELTNFDDRRVCSYQGAVTGEVAFHEEF
jgi:hypothetical protein